MTAKHLSPQFDAELSGVSSRVLDMGGMVEAQVAQAVYALTNFSIETAAQVISTEERVYQLEVEIDRDLSGIIARRQPTARDLRLLIAISKTIGNLERVGDEAARIARTVQHLVSAGVSSRMRLRHRPHRTACGRLRRWPGHRHRRPGADRYRAAQWLLHPAGRAHHGHGAETSPAQQRCLR